MNNIYTAHYICTYIHTCILIDIQTYVHTYFTYMNTGNYIAFLRIFSTLNYLFQHFLAKILGKLDIFFYSKIVLNVPRGLNSGQKTQNGHLVPKVRCFSVYSLAVDTRQPLLCSVFAHYLI
jgi:hypothetical protein